MAEYIEREAVLKKIDTAIGEYAQHGEIVRFIGDCRASIIYAPAADVVEVVHGEWTHIKDYGDYCLGHCSVCWTPQEAAFPSALKEGFRYCRWCGAKMDGERRSDE